MKATTYEEFFKIGVNDNPQLIGCSGMFGREFVFRQLNGVTVVSRAPRKPGKQTAHQRCNRQRFRAASGFAKKEMLDPQRKEFYKELAKVRGLPNGYTAAVQEYMRMPETLVELYEPAYVDEAVGKVGDPCCLRKCSRMKYGSTLRTSLDHDVHGNERLHVKAITPDAKIITLGALLSSAKYEQQDAFCHSSHCHCRGHPMCSHAITMGDHSCR